MAESASALIELNTKVVSRLHEFVSKGQKVPESFRFLANRLSFLIELLRHNASQIEAGRLSSDAIFAVQSLIRDIHKQISIVHSILFRTSPPNLEKASDSERVLRALKSLAEEEEFTSAVDKIDKDIDLLVSHQDKHHNDIRDILLKELSRLGLAPIGPTTNHGGHHFPSVTATGHAQVHLGDVHYHTIAYKESGQRDESAPSETYERDELERDRFTADPRLQHSFGSLLNLSAKLEDSINPSQARSSLQHLVTVLGQIAASTSATMGICEDSLRDLLYRTISIFNLSRELQMAHAEEGSFKLRSHMEQSYRQVPKGKHCSIAQCSLHGSQRSATLVTADNIAWISSKNVSTCLPKPVELRNRKVPRSQEVVDKRPAMMISSISVRPSHEIQHSKEARVASWQTDFGRIDLISEARHLQESESLDGDSQGQDEMFSVTVVLTPTLYVASKKQLFFRGKQRLGRVIHSIAPSTLQIRNIRHHTSEIFEIAMFGTVNQMTWLLGSGQGALTDCDELGRSLLSYALFLKNSRMIKFLLNNGADVDAFDVGLCGWEGDFEPQHVLLQAVIVYVNLSDDFRYEHTESVTAMLQSGADPTHGDLIGYTMARYLLSFASLGCVKAMLDHGYPFVSVNAIEGEDESPLLLLLESSVLNVSGNYQIADKIALFLSRGADCHGHGEWGNTCLHLALLYDSEDPDRRRCEFENIVIPGFDGELKDILMLLITSGANVYARNDDGESASDFAQDWGHEREWNEALIECGYDPDEVNGGKDEDACWSSGSDFQRNIVQRQLLTLVEYLVIRMSRRRVEEVYDCDTEDDDDGPASEVDSEDWFDGETWAPSGSTTDEATRDTDYQNWQEDYGSADEPEDMITDDLLEDEVESQFSAASPEEPKWLKSKSD